MFFPIRDENPTRSAPVVNLVLLAANVAVHLWTWSSVPQGVEWMSVAYGLTPSRLLADPSVEWLTVFTSMFMHGGWYHLFANMWTLHIFGDNVEDAMGKARYLGFYLLCGIAAAAAQVAIDPHSAVPMVGASGAIGGVVGGYLVLHPRAPILAFNMLPLLWLFFGLVLVVPAWVIALVFLGQNLLLALQNAAGFGSGGIAFAAHLGGFFAGLILVPLLAQRRRVARYEWAGLRSSRRPVKRVFWRN